MKNRRRKEKELKRRETLALQLYGSTKDNVIRKNHRRIVWLRKYLGLSNKPKRISVAELLLRRMTK
jgi:hypothetical protein